MLSDGWWSLAWLLGKPDSNRIVTEKPILAIRFPFNIPIYFSNVGFVPILYTDITLRYLSFNTPPPLYFFKDCDMKTLKFKKYGLSSEKLVKDYQFDYDDCLTTSNLLAIKPYTAQIAS